MTRCYDCGKIYRGGKNWKFSQGFYTLYATCPDCSKHNPQKEIYRDLRIKR